MHNVEPERDDPLLFELCQLRGAIADIVDQLEREHAPEYILSTARIVKSYAHKLDSLIDEYTG